MTQIAHIIDRNTPLDMLEQLFALRCESEPVFSLGPKPNLSLTAAADGVEIRELTHHRFAFREKAVLPAGVVLHIWGTETFCSSTKCKNFGSGNVVLSPGGLPQDSKYRSLFCKQMDIPNLILTAPTKYSKNELLQSGVSENKVTILPPVVKPLEDSVESIRSNIRGSLGISDSDKLVVVPSEMQRGAGHKMASWAHAIVEQLTDNCKIVFPGGGNYQQSVKFFSDTTGYPDDIFFTGSRFTIRDILSAGDIAVFFYERSCGVTILAEAMMSGLTIVGVNSGDTAEMLRHDQSALLVPPNHPREASASLLRVVEDSQLGNRLAKNAAEFAAANFNLTKIRPQLDEIYAKISTRENN